MTCCTDPHYIVYGKHETVGASSPPIYGYCPNDNRRRTICSGGSIPAAAPISPQIPIQAKYSKNEGKLWGKWVQRPRSTPRSESRLAATAYCVNGIRKQPMKLWRLEILY
eukprot:scaffold248340_cov40-Cyclotella_meneghiniana.AAC.5